MKINEIMTQKVEFITPQANTKDAARLMHDNHIGALPVMDNDQLVGILTDRDICCKVTATGRDAGWTKVEEIMVKDVTTCFDDQDITDAANIMKEHQIRRLPVINHDNKMTGFVSVDDIARSSHELASTVLEASAPIH